MRRFIFGIILLVGLGLFYELVLVAPSPEDQTARNLQSSTRESADAVDNSNKTQPDRGIVNKEEGLKTDAFAEFWESLKKKISFDQGVETKEPLDNTADNQKTETPENEAANSQTPESATQPQNPEAEKIKKYLIASSDIGFPQNTVELQLSLHLAEDGDFAKLIGLIQDFEQKYEILKRLSPPAQAAEIHQKSLDITARFIQLLRDARNEKRGSVEATWDSPERAAIISQAQEVMSKIRGLVAQYNIQLPPDVLP